MRYFLATEDFQSLVNQEVQLGGEIQAQTVSIDIYDNDEYDDAEKIFIVQLTILESDFDNLRVSSASVQIQILEDDESPLLGKLVHVCECTVVRPGCYCRYRRYRVLYYRFSL